MPKIEWNDQLSVGVKDIDDQHRELIRIANNLAQAASLGQEQQILDKVLAELHEYTHFHFQSEEELMDKIQYPDRDEHIKEHVRLKEDVKNYEHLIHEDKDPTPESIIDFVKEWLFGHILTYDLKLANFIHNQQEIPTLKWNEALTTGVEIIDSQHKELIRIANGLMKAVARGKDKEAVDAIVRRLREYTVFHFNSEEELMGKIRYPKRGEQAQEHARLKREVKDFQQQLFHKETLTSNAILEFVKDWLLGHILTYDRDLANFIHEQEAEATEVEGESVTEVEVESAR